MPERHNCPRHLFYFILTILLVIFLSSVFGAVFGFAANRIEEKLSQKFPAIFHLSDDQSKNKSALTVSREKIIEEDSAVINTVEKSSPAVVSIIVSKDAQKIKRFSNPFDFFNNVPSSQGSTEKEKIGGGTGFIITANGMIVTNKHVVSDTAADYSVLTNDGKEYNAKVLARDPLNDIAVIKIDGTDYPTLDFGDSDALKIGQTVIAIGNSLGEFSNTVSKGIISGLKRSVTANGGLGDSEKLTNIIQTDAAINPGNSGGPLLDINGNVIGINVAIAQGAENIGFAIPASQVKRIADQVEKTGKISTPYLGVRYLPIDEALQKQINLPFNYGALIVRGQSVTDFAVVPGSPADKAGIAENDAIFEINGTKIDDKNGLTDLLSKFNVSDEIILKVWHKGETKEIKVKLEERK
ncbi:MAG TPA: hypothetical protein DCS28_02655 [Candidatus Moranbacteria bacterium]|nr:hypothetical protein [Candidatus Moranbacteria bacterium]HAT74916.1 hypothetical protein [Candidatus Moranbacteria bacterium]